MDISCPSFLSTAKDDGYSSHETSLEEETMSFCCLNPPTDHLVSLGSAIYFVENSCLSYKTSLGNFVVTHIFVLREVSLWDNFYV